jgi:hypothetical protein
MQFSVLKYFIIKNCKYEQLFFGKKYQNSGIELMLFPSARGRGNLVTGHQLCSVITVITVG